MMSFSIVGGKERRAWHFISQRRRKIPNEWNSRKWRHRRLPIPSLTLNDKRLPSHWVSAPWAVPFPHPAKKSSAIHILTHYEPLFRSSGILGQPREVDLKFRNEIPENVCSIAPPPGISGIFGRMESARNLHINLKLLTNRARGPYWGILARARDSTDRDRGPIFPSTALAS